MADTAPEPAALEIKPTPAMRLRVLSLIAAAIVVLLVLGSLLLGGQGKFFAQRTTLTAYMPDATGLVVGSEVRLSGFPVGKVSSIAISNSSDRKRAVVAELRVEKQYLKGIPSDSLVDISADTLVGAQFVDIAEGKSPVPIAENGILESEPVTAASDRADLIRSLQNRLEQVDDILQQLSSTDSDLGHFVHGEREYDNLLSTIRGLDGGVHAYLAPRTEFFKAFHNLDDYNSWMAGLASADRQLTALENNPLVTSPKQYDDLVKQLHDIRVQLDQMKANGMLTDDAAYLRIARQLRDTDRLLGAFTHGEGRAGSLLANAQLYESLNGSLRKLQAMLTELRVAPGKFLRSKLF